MHISLHIEHTITLDFFNSFFSGFFSSSISDTKILIVFSFPLVKSFTDNSLLIIFPPYKKYILRCNNALSEFDGEIKSLEYLQNCKIFYKFKNIDILEQALTHKSKNYSFSKNYEKLELLGDSIVESFISQYTYCIFLILQRFLE